MKKALYFLGTALCVIFAVAAVLAPVQSIDFKMKYPHIESIGMLICAAVFCLIIPVGLAVFAVICCKNKYGSALLIADLSLIILVPVFLFTLFISNYGVCSYTDKMENCAKYDSWVEKRLEYCKIPDLLPESDVLAHARCQYEYEAVYGSRGFYAYLLADFDSEADFNAETARLGALGAKKNGEYFEFERFGGNVSAAYKINTETRRITYLIRENLTPEDCK
ncbi:MAG: hypothetical protein IJL87_06480 [Clostridia bacterium]|nr:hypothetical protein [Clostridia bacterium]